MKINAQRLAGIVLVASACSFAQFQFVVVDDMKGITNKTLAGGYVFNIFNGKDSINTNPMAGSQLLYPNPAGKWTYFDLVNDGKGETGQVARVVGIIKKGTMNEPYPYIGYGCYIANLKDTLANISETVKAFAFQARGVGMWRFKFSSPLIDSITLAIGKDTNEVAWHYKMIGLDSTSFQWYVCPADKFMSNVGEFTTKMTGIGYTYKDLMKKVTKAFWQTDGYDSSRTGTSVRIDVKNFIIMGSLTSMGLSTAQPTADVKTTLTNIYNQIEGSAVGFAPGSLRMIQIDNAETADFAVNGRALGVASTERTKATGIAIRKAGSGKALTVVR